MNSGIAVLPNMGVKRKTIVKTGSLISGSMPPVTVIKKGPYGILGCQSIRGCELGGSGKGVCLALGERKGARVSRGGEMGCADRKEL